MATIFADLSSETVGVSDGVYTPDAETSSGTPITLHLFGTFSGAEASVEVSTYNDGSNDIYTPVFTGIQGPRVLTIDFETDVKFRVVVKELSSTSSVFATTGGGNT
jgi:hypothetical protein